MITSHPRVQAFDIYGTIAFDAIRIDGDTWLWIVGLKYVAMMYGRRKDIITFLTEAIMDTRPRTDEEAAKLNWITKVTGPGLAHLMGPKSIEAAVGLIIDRAGNTWLNGAYLPATEYVPTVVPEDDDGDVG